VPYAAATKYLDHLPFDPADQSAETVIFYDEWSTSGPWLPLLSICLFGASTILFADTCDKNAKINQCKRLCYGFRKILRPFEKKSLEIYNFEYIPLRQIIDRNPIIIQMMFVPSSYPSIQSEHSPSVLTHSLPLGTFPGSKYCSGVCQEYFYNRDQGCTETRKKYSRLTQGVQSVKSRIINY
jgi:hypothetical protein